MHFHTHTTSSLLLAPWGITSIGMHATSFPNLPLEVAIKKIQVGRQMNRGTHGQHLTPRGSNHIAPYTQNITRSTETTACPHSLPEHEASHGLQSTPLVKWSAMHTTVGHTHHTLPLGVHTRGSCMNAKWLLFGFFGVDNSGFPKSCGRYLYVASPHTRCEGGAEAAP